MTKPRKKLTGERYGRFCVLEQADDYITPTGKRRTQWLCQCDCGKQFIAETTNILKGNTKSCGCFARERSVQSSITHGGRYSRLYSIWSNIVTRCYNHNASNYKNYGGRGIAMCEEWRDSFESFRSWANENGYSDMSTIDRINNELGYSPDNCRWATPSTQAKNRRSTVAVTVDGVTMTLSEWADTLGYSRSIFHSRAKLYNTSVSEQVIALVRRHKQDIA